METLLAAVLVSGGGIVGALVALIVIGLIYWICTAIPLPQPFLKIAYVLCVVFAVLVVLNLLLGFGGHAFISW